MVGGGRAMAWVECVRSGLADVGRYGVKVPSSPSFLRPVPSPVLALTAVQWILTPCRGERACV